MQKKYTICIVFLCKQQYLAKLNLEKAIFKTETINYMQHEWSLVTFKTVSKNRKYPAVEEEEESESRSEQKEEQREIATFCSIICEFSIFLCYFLQ